MSWKSKSEDSEHVEVPLFSSAIEEICEKEKEVDQVVSEIESLGDDEESGTKLLPDLNLSDDMLFLDSKESDDISKPVSFKEDDGQEKIDDQIQATVTIENVVQTSLDDIANLITGDVESKHSLELKGNLTVTPPSPVELLPVPTLDSDSLVIAESKHIIHVAGDLSSDIESLSVSSRSKSIAKSTSKKSKSKTNSVISKAQSTSNRSAQTSTKSRSLKSKATSDSNTSSGSISSKERPDSTSKSSSSNLSLTISSLPTLSEGEIISQFYSQGQVIPASRIDYSEETGQISESNSHNESVVIAGMVGVPSSLINTTHDDLSSTLERISAIEGESFGI